MTILINPLPVGSTAGNHLDVFFETKDTDKVQLLYKVDGLNALVKKYYKVANEKENALLMEFVLHGLAAHSLISKKVLDGKIEFKDLMGSMFNMGTQSLVMKILMKVILTNVNEAMVNGEWSMVNQWTASTYNICILNRKEKYLDY
jgi:hypothetical protein